jgi:hypothetical protein
MRQSLGRICKQQASKRTAVSRPVDAKLSIQRPDLASKLASVGLSLCLLSGNVESCYAASMNTLADVMRPTYEFVDSNKNGVITLDEIKQLSSEVWCVGSDQHSTQLPTCTEVCFVNVLEICGNIYCFLGTYCLTFMFKRVLMLIHELPRYD